MLRVIRLMEAALPGIRRQQHAEARNDFIEAMDGHPRTQEAADVLYPST